MKRFTTLLVVSMGILFILVPVAFAGSGSPEKPEGEIPRGLAIQGDAPGEKLVGVVAMEHYGFYRVLPWWKAGELCQCKSDCKVAEE